MRVGGRGGLDVGIDDGEVGRVASTLRGKVNSGEEERGAVFGSHDCTDHSRGSRVCGGEWVDAGGVLREGTYRTIRVVEERDASTTRSVLVL
jgi:hypothetical protein